MRIFGVEIPLNKQIFVALTSIYGIGISLARKICNLSNIHFYKKAKFLKYFEWDKIVKEINKINIEGELKKNISVNIKRLIDIKCYRGIRHQKKLPVRGQRTRTNARTKKGSRKLLFLKNLKINENKKNSKIKKN